MNCYEPPGPVCPVGLGLRVSLKDCGRAGCLTSARPPLLQSGTPSREEWTPRASPHRAEEGLSGSADFCLSWLKECLLLSPLQPPWPPVLHPFSGCLSFLPQPQGTLWAPGLGAAEEAGRVVGHTGCTCQLCPMPVHSGPGQPPSVLPGLALPVDGVLVQLAELPVHREDVHVVVLLEVPGQQLHGVVSSLQALLVLVDLLHLWGQRHGVTEGLATLSGPGRVPPTLTGGQSR